MSRKHVEDHVNHEAWAIPYADLMTLLLAFFVVMYAMSSRNENKYKAVSDALHSVFGGNPRNITPIQLEERPSIRRPLPIKSGLPPPSQQHRRTPAQAQARLQRIADDLEHALRDLIAKQLIIVHRKEWSLEVEINSDILFATGSALLEHDARAILHKVAQVLSTTGNPVRIEGYTDNRPIHNARFPSNWELSAARAASVVHLLAEHAIPQELLSMTGFGEYRPFADNRSEEGRNRNRRVVLVVLAEQHEQILAQHLVADSARTETSRFPSPLEMRQDADRVTEEHDTIAPDGRSRPYPSGQMLGGTP